MVMYSQNECQVVGELQDRISLHILKNGFEIAEFYLKTPKFKTNQTQSLRCVCKTPHARFIAEKFQQGDRLLVKGALDTVVRCFEDGYMNEVTILVKQCSLFNQTMMHYPSF